MNSKILEKWHNSLFIPPSQTKVLKPVNWRIVKSSIKRKRPARGRDTMLRNEDRVIVHHLLNTYYVLCVFMSLFSLIFPTTLENIILPILSMKQLRFRKVSNLNEVIQHRKHKSRFEPKFISFQTYHYSFTVGVPFWEVCRMGVQIHLVES